MEPLVSIIIPVYRTEAYLNDCMACVLGQSYQNLEIILVDDESPDNCPRMCDEYARRDARVKVIHRPNGGLSAARNSGLEIASGEYVTFLDSDDLIATDMVAHMVELADDAQADLVKICLIRCYDGVIPERTLGSSRTMSGMQVLQTIYQVPQQIISACGKLFRRELFDGIRFPEGRYYEDEYTTPKLYARSKRVVLSQSVMYFYMQWDNGSIMRSGLTEEKVRDALDMTRERIAFFEEIGLKNMVREAKKDHYYKLLAMEKRTASEQTLAAVNQMIRQERKQFAKMHRLLVAQIKLRSGLSRLKNRIADHK